MGSEMCIRDRLNNLDILGIDSAKLDAMVLSHGHYDHFGGMVGFLKATQEKRKPKLPLYIGGEECFCSRQFTAGPTPLNFGALDRKAIAEADLVVTTAEGPALIADHAFATGHIPRATFERVLSPTRMKVGIDNGLGCFPDKMPPDRRPIDWAPDEFDHEISTCVNVKGHGLVVTTSCGHRGVGNSVKQAMAVSGVQKVHASSEVSIWRHTTRTMSGRPSRNWSISTSTTSSRCTARGNHSTRFSRQNCRRR